MPMDSPNCETHWNYVSHGRDWKCRCESGKEQSPIDVDLNNISPLMYWSYFRYNAEFTFFAVPKERIKTKYYLHKLEIHINSNQASGKKNENEDKKDEKENKKEEG